MLKLALIILLLSQSAASPQTSFGFGAALAHAHAAGARFDVTGAFCGHKLVTDPSNTPGHNFYGNAICVNSGAGPRWYWYDWPADTSAGVKIAKWSNSGLIITLQVADPECLLALSAVEGRPTAVSLVSGSGVYRGTATLAATLTSGGSPLVGKTISFTLNGAPAGTAVTDAGGAATNTNVGISGIDAGTYPAAVVATFAREGDYIGSSGTGTLAISKAEQAITFAPVTDKTFGAPGFALHATASSGLSVSFSAAGDCTVAGATVHITGAGTCVVKASQAGDLNFGPAPDVARSFQIAKAATATSVVSSASTAAHGRPVTFTATVTSTAGTPTGSVQFKVDGSDSGPPRALDAGGVASLSTAGLSAGAHVVTADYGGDANFNPSAGTLAGGQSVGGLFEFAQALFTVNERDGSVAVTVRRRGDASQAAAVEYATDDGSDPSVAIPCPSVTGRALERCDYTRAQGLLQFAPGETEKTFPVLVNLDSYLEGAETTRVRLSNPAAGSVLGETPSAVIEIADDAQQTTHPLADSEFFVRQHYHDFLSRVPDPQGLAFWAGEIEQCGSDAACREVKRINVSAAFFLSIEFQQTGYVAYLRNQLMNNTGERMSLGAFQSDMQELSRGLVVGGPGWEETLEANKRAYFDRYAAGFSPAATPAQVVDSLNARTDDPLNPSAGPALTQAERDQLVADLTSGAKTRGQVLRAVTENAEFRRRQLGKAFVLMQYFGYLRRAPNESPDSNFDGYDFWLSKLNEFDRDYIAAEMVKAFIFSDEYRKRFGQ